MHPPPEPSETHASKGIGRRRLKIRFVVRIAILTCAIIFFAFAIRRAALELGKSEVPLDWNSILWSQIGLSVIAGMLAMVPAWIGWHAILRDFGHRVHWSASLYAYFLGHLGKYIPGKAMAVMLRVGQLHRHKVPLGPAILSVFIETLTGFASGGVLGAVLLQWVEVPGWLRWSALAAIPLAALPLIPHPFRGILRLVSRMRIGKGLEKLLGVIDGRLMIRTIACALLGWCLQGLALWFVLGSLRPIQSDLLSGYSGGFIWLVCTASMSLGGLAGFLSMLPGGAFARELASIGVLLSIVPEPIALIATVIVRLTSIAAEILMIVGSKSISASVDSASIQ